MIHTALIVIHAAAAVTAFGFGCALMVRPPERSTAVRLVAYLVAIAIAVVALVTVVAVDFARLPLVKQIAFSALVVLAIVLLVRSILAVRNVALRPARWMHRFVGHIGFVLISLFDGFCIVFTIDLKLPPYVVAASAVLGVVVGVLAIRGATKRIPAAT